MNSTDAMDAGDVTAIFCPECGDEVEDAGVAVELGVDLADRAR